VKLRLRSDHKLQLPIRDRNFVEEEDEDPWEFYLEWLTVNEIKVNELENVFMNQPLILSHKYCKSKQSVNSIEEKLFYYSQEYHIKAQHVTTLGSPFIKDLVFDLEQEIGLVRKEIGKTLIEYVYKQDQIILKLQ